MFSYTKKDTSVYAIVLQWPEAEEALVFSSAIPTEETSVQWVGYKGSLKWKQRPEGGMVVQLPRLLPSSIPCQWAWTFKLTKLKNL